ncbi:LysM peptidoglycan-binding domain-containing protein [Aureimonas psammosilenae]|uniref:LysM peptidoglycan-binding domain-containing protein n=1 Tax=Aureimonas psammosilenae TaxID=2495496 RepID=UPI0012612530|nr:LysM peptidoglycan-binding domain-containing protein [Aureimonas psammosilenae]
MNRKFSVLVIFCIVLFGAILAGYWDMLTSEKARQVEASAGDAGTASVDAAPSGPGVPASVAPSSEQAALTPKDAAPAASAPAATAPAVSAPSSAPAAPPARMDAPRFDILRVEPNGSAVIAGKAAPDSEVRILSDGRVIATVKATRDGDFAAVLEERLPVGSHQLRIEAKRPDGESSVSPEVAVVSVPKPDQPDQLLAMIEAPGQPSRLIATPKAEEEAVASPSSASAAPGGPEVPTAAPAAQPPQTFAVEAVEIENGTIYIAGRAEGREPVRVYVDNKLIGEDKTRNEGRFLVTAKAPIGEGDHRIRADVLGSNGAVASRVEVPFTKPEGETMSALAGAVPSAAGSDVAAEAPVSGTETAQPEKAGGEEVATVVQPALETVGARVLIRRGDSLWRISRRTYGLGRRYTVIYLANGDQIRNPNRIYPGQVFRLPDHEQGGTAER